jgi:hypothetical protein
MEQKSCKSRDLVLSWQAIFLWCLPVIALIVGSYWRDARLLLWIPSFLVMGIACMVNARRCGRIHCYVTGPLSLLAIGYIVLAQFHVLPMNAGDFLNSFLAIPSSLVL